MAIPEHLLADMDEIDVNTLLQDWRWLLNGRYKKVMMTALGDLFVRDEAGQIHFLDLMCGELKWVADSEKQFEKRLEDRSVRRSFFIGFLIMELQKRHGR